MGWNMIRYCTFTLLLFLWPSLSWATAYTSTQDGDWSNVATWGGSGVPGDGDTVIIATGHDVSVADDRTVGVSGATGTEAIQVQGTGTLTVAAGAMLTVRGDLNQQRGSTVTVSGTLILDPATGATYVWKCLTTGTGVANVIAAGPSPTIRALVKNGARGGISRLNFDSSQLYGDLKLSNTIFESLGSESVRALDHYIFYAGKTNTQANVLWKNCGVVYVNSPAGDKGYDWSGVDFRGQLNADAFILSGNNDLTTGTRIAANISVYNTTANPSKTFQVIARNSTISNLYLYNTLTNFSAESKNLTISNVFQAIDSAATGVTAFNIGLYNSNNNLSDSIFLLRSDNQHFIASTNSNNSLSTNIVHHCIFDGDNYTNVDTGDVFIPAGPLTAHSNIAINKAGTFATALVANTVLTAYNNTSYGSYGIAVGETAGASTQMALVRNNLFVSQPDGIHQNSAFSAQTNFTLDHNAYWDMTTAANIDFGGNNTYMGAQSVANWWATGAYGDAGKGSDDIYANPGFIDPTRTVRGYGSWVSVQAAAREMITVNGIAYDGTIVIPTTKTVSAMAAWIKYGFTPTNPALKTAGYGGTYIGAMDVVSLGNPAALLMVQ